MKKFLVGVIFLIPIVVVIALSATGAIISLTTPVNPSGMVIKDSDNVELDKNAVIKIDSRNFDEFIVIDVLPAITQDKAITYERVEEAGDGEVILERIGNTNRYSITPVKVGVTKLEIRAKANVNVYQELTIYVTSDSIDSINLYDEEGKDIGEYRNVYSGERYYVDINPIEALRNNDIQWSSSNTSVAEISANGEMKVVGKGLARIKVTAVDKDGNTVSDYVDIDTSGALVASKSIYTAESEITADWLKTNYALDNEVNVSEIGDNLYSFRKGDAFVNVELKNASLTEWGFIELADVMYTRNGGYYPLVGTLVKGEIIKGATIEILNAEVLQREPVTGMLVPLKAGSATVRASYNGVSVEKEVSVRENPVAFELELGAADQKLGIQLTRTWGQYFFDENGGLTDSFTFGLSDDSNSFDVEWEVDEPSYVNITPVENSQDIIITFLEGVRGNSVKVTATLKVNNLLQNRVKRSFTFNVREKNAINVYSWDEIEKVVELRRYDMVLQSDIYFKDTVGLSSSIYGNGFKIDCTDYSNLGDGFRKFAFQPPRIYNGHYEWEESGHTEGGFVIDDVVAIGSKVYADLKGQGKVFSFINFYWSRCPITVRYCQFSGFNEGLYIHDCLDVTIVGNIFGDNINNGVALSYEPGRAESCNVTFRNNIFKQSGGAAIQLVPSLFYESAMDKVMDVKVNFEGFLDVYNWKQRSEFGGVFANSMLGLVGSDILTGTLRDTLANAVSDVVNSFIQLSEYDGLFYKHSGKDYASFAFVGIGLLAVADKDRVEMNTDNPLRKFGIPLEDENGKPKGKLGSVVTLVGLVIHASSPHITNECFLVCTDFVGREPEIRPGDPVPNSKELYEKLVGTLDK